MLASQNDSLATVSFSKAVRAVQAGIFHLWRPPRTHMLFAYVVEAKAEKLANLGYMLAPPLRRWVTLGR